MSLYLHGVALAVACSVMMVLPNAFAEESSKAKEKEKPRAPDTRQEGDRQAQGTADKRQDKNRQTQRDPDTRRDMERHAQMTLGGAKYFVIGPISRIDDNYFYVKDEELGDEVRLVMDEGSKVICVYQTAEGSVRDCVLSVGDRVRAEVSALGTVTTLRALPPEEKPPMTKTSRQLGDILNIASPNGDYVIVPAPFGSLRDVEPPRPTPVKAPNGKVLGTLHKLVLDAGSGRIVCAVIRKAEDDTLVPVPWGDLKISNQDGAVVLTNQYLQLEPEDSPKTLLDHSPSVENLNRLVQELQEQGSQPDQRADAGQTKSGQEAQRTSQARKANCPDPGSVKGDVIRGRVVDVQDNFMIVKDDAGKLIHVHRDSCTQQVSQRIRSNLFVPGDEVEVYATPKGHALSVSMTRPATYASFPDQ